VENVKIAELKIGDTYLISEQRAASTDLQELHRDLQDWQKECNKCHQFTAADFDICGGIRSRNMAKGV